MRTKTDTKCEAAQPELRGRSPFDWKTGEPSVFATDPYFNGGKPTPPKRHGDDWTINRRNGTANISIQDEKFSFKNGS